MHKPSLMRILLKDFIDFAIIFGGTLVLTLGIYVLLPQFQRVSLSLYFFEQALELFFVNPRLFAWLIGLGFGVTIIYYLFCGMLLQTTIGGLVARVVILDRKSQKPLSLGQSLVMAIGAYTGVIAFLVGPLSAWWLDAEHRGWAEIWARTLSAKKALAIPKSE